jgi:Arc/MetJ-type ribon-helix-helix transcriptional regulator
MATKKVTITLEVAQPDRVRELVEAGKASSVSRFVEQAVGVSRGDISGWGALPAPALRDTAGPLSRDEKAWAGEMLGTQKRRTRSVA